MGKIKPGLFFRIAGDLIALNISFVSVYFVRILLSSVFTKPVFTLKVYLPYILVTNMVLLIVFFHQKLFINSNTGDFLRLVPRIARGMLITYVMVWAGFFFTNHYYKGFVISRLAILLSLFFSIIFISFVHYFVGKNKN